MYTAHYDHFGIRPDMPGDNIFNGANDNALVAEFYWSWRGLDGSASSGRGGRFCLRQ